MATKKNGKAEYFEIDYVQIVQTLWHRLWIIILCAVIGAIGALTYAKFGIAPWYTSSIMLYVNTNSINVGGQPVKVTASSITAGENLISTYAVLLKNRTTLRQIVEETDVGTSLEELMSAISVSPIEDTAVFSVYVTTDDPEKSAIIANTIAKVLPLRVDEIIEGSSMKVVDKAVPSGYRAGPSLTSYTIKGFGIGAAVAVIVLIIVALLDDLIHDEEYLANNFDIPVFAKVPDLTRSAGRLGYYRRKGYYYSGYKSGGYGKYGYGGYRKKGYYYSRSGKNRDITPPEGEARAELDSEINVRKQVEDPNEGGEK